MHELSESDQGFQSSNNETEKERVKVDLEWHQAFDVDGDGTFDVWETWVGDHFIKSERLPSDGSFYGGGWISFGTGAGIWGSQSQSHAAWVVGVGAGFQFGYATTQEEAAEKIEHTELVIGFLPGVLNPYAGVLLGGLSVTFDPHKGSFGADANWGTYIPIDLMTHDFTNGDGEGPPSYDEPVRSKVFDFSNDLPTAAVHAHIENFPTEIRAELVIA